ncbi:protein of unknown function [Shewanella benthica]|uniref:Uncharacterized protein n=1 Tax=Shewanella benthica TaxID=43661 RepID=A0A330M0Y5_9GAMM|nr:protein of unknown function [Shewanella benthica]
MTDLSREILHKSKPEFKQYL